MLYGLVCIAALFLLVYWIMNGILTGIDMDKVLGVFRTIALIYGASLFLSLFQQLIMTTVTHRFTQSLRTQIAGKIDRLPMAYYHQTSTGDVLSRVTNDVDMIGQSFNQSLGTFFASITLFFGSLFMMLRSLQMLRLPILSPGKK